MSGGAGIGGAGSGAAGTIAVTSEDGRGVVRPPQALYFDASVMDFPIDDNGRYIEVHPVDHKASMLLIPLKGSIAGAPDQGSPWLSLPMTDETSMTARATELVLGRWASLIANGDIGGVTVYATPRGPEGRAFVRVQYENLRDPQRKPANPYRTITING